MSAPIDPRFAGGPQVSEKPKGLNELGNTPDENLNPLTNLDGEDLKMNGGGMYAEYQKPSIKSDKDPLGTIELDENPDAELEANLTAVDEDKDASEVLNEKISKENEHPLSPIINSFIPRGLSVKQGQEIKSGLAKGGDIKDILANMDIDKNKAKSLVEAVEYLQKPEVKEKNVENFNTDFKDQLEEFKAKGEGGNIVFVGIAGDTAEVLGGNYFVNLDQRNDGNEGIQKVEALNIAFEVSANQIIDGVSIRRDEGFDEMMKAIKNPDLDFSDRFKELSKLNTEVNKQEGVKSVVGKKTGKKMKKTLIANNDAAENFQEAQSTKAKAEAELHKNDQALEELNLSSQAPEEVGGDVFSAGDLDTATAVV